VRRIHWESGQLGKTLNTQLIFLAHLLFLPACSPDLNPIEQVFAKLKTPLRKAEERTVDGLWQCIGKLLQCFTPQECTNYLRNSGYAST